MAAAAGGPKAVHQDASLTPQQKRDKIRALRQDTRTQVESLLTPQQQQKLQQMRSGRAPAGKRGAAPPGGF